MTEIKKEIRLSRRIKRIFVQVKTFIRVLFYRYNRHEIPAQAAELAYYLITALIAMAVIIVYAAQSMQGLITIIKEDILTLLPENIQVFTISILDNIVVPANFLVMLFSFIATYWLVSRATHSMMTSFDKIYEVKVKRKAIKMRALSLLFTSSILVLFILLFVFEIVEDQISYVLDNILEYDGFFSQRMTTIRLLISTVSMCFIFMILYSFLPDRKIKLMQALPGSIFTTLFWLVILQGYSNYINNISSLSWILGSVGSVFVFLVWVYWSCIVLLLGAEINAIIVAINDKEDKYIIHAKTRRTNE